MLSSEMTPRLANLGAWVRALTVICGAAVSMLLWVTEGPRVGYGAIAGVLIAMAYWELTARITRNAVQPGVSPAAVGAGLLSKTLFLFAISWIVLRAGASPLGFGLGWASLLVGLVAASLFCGVAKSEEGVVHG